MESTVEKWKKRIRTGDRRDVIERHGDDDWRHAYVKGGVCVGTTTHTSEEDARAATWSDNVKVKR